jgi:membrane protein YqaA with SNARE-associated domain
MSHWELIGATFLYCVGSAIIPVMHAEAYLITVSALSPPAVAWALVVAGTAGQMVGKVVMYGAGRGVVHIPNHWLQHRVAVAAARYQGQRNLGNGLIFISSSTGFPPFFFVSVAAGLLRVPLPSFIVFGAAGRFLRFTVAVFLPQIIKSLH